MHFEAALSSHVLGCHKPDPVVYQRALAALQVGPEAVVFFDDVAANVEAARTVEIAAFQVGGVVELRTCLIALGLLHDPGGAQAFPSRWASGRGDRGQAQSVSHIVHLTTQWSRLKK